MTFTRRGKRYQVHISSFINVVHDRGNFITRAEAALILGIQRDSISKLIKAGLLKTCNTGTGRYEKLSRNDVINLLNECRGKYTRKKVKGFKLHEALIKYSVNGLSIVRILEFTLGGVLHPHSNGSDSLVGNIYKINELERCLNILKQEQQVQEGYTFTDVLKILHIGEKKAKQLVKNGILVPIKVVKNKAGRKIIYFSKNNIEKLRSFPKIS